MGKKLPPLEVRLKALGVVPLKPGEVSKTIRIRVPIQIYEAVSGLGPLERGEVVRAGLIARGHLKEV